MFVPHDIEGLDKELYGFLSRYAADRYPDALDHHMQEDALQQSATDIAGLMTEQAQSQRCECLA